ncbi:transketolase C-terminal domain-containing protein [Paenibacillus fonticola]|uniref:transketolase C-terminal domain-containing protein n=1 Tax=Paenibacillus fonticola TaxID=379896 RepID=UPI00036B50FD
MNITEMQEKAIQIRRDTLQILKHTPAGYSGTSLSHIDILVVLYYGMMKLDPLNPTWEERDRFLYCQDHSVEALYSILADRGFFPAHELQSFRRYGSRLIGHPNRQVPGIEMTGGVVGHGLSEAVGMALTAHMNKQNYRVFTLMDEAEISNGKTGEAALSASRYNLDNLITIVELRGASGEPTPDKLRQSREFADKWRSLGWDVVIVNGNGIDELYRALQETRSRKGKPQLLVAHTVQQTESDLRTDTGAGAGSSQVVSGDKALPWKNGALDVSDGPMTVGQMILEYLLEKARADQDIVLVLDESIAMDEISRYAAELPDQIIQIEYAEEQLVGIAAGLAVSGKKPFVLASANFLTMRAIEQIKMNVSYSSANVKLIGLDGGVSCGAKGMAYHSIQDIALIRGIPRLATVIPSDHREITAMLDALLLHEGGVYARVGRIPMKEVYTAEDKVCFELGKAVQLRDGQDLTLIAAGEMVQLALETAAALAKDGIGCQVLNMHTIKPLDEDAVLRAARETGHLITLEEHSVLGGLGSAVSEFVIQKCPVPLRIVGVPDEPSIAGNVSEIFDHYSLTYSSIRSIARKMLKNSRKK